MDNERIEVGDSVDLTMIRHGESKVRGGLIAYGVVLSATNKGDVPKYLVRHWAPWGITSGWYSADWLKKTATKYVIDHMQG